MEPKTIYFRTIKTGLDIEGQIDKVNEEYAEFKNDILYMNYNWKEEATDLIQSVMTLLENHTNERFELLWNKHIIKMSRRNWTAREHESYMITTSKQLSN